MHLKIWYTGKCHLTMKVKSQDKIIEGLSKGQSCICFKGRGKYPQRE